ncbi:RNA polymerase sigma factor (sigma-70 family) [Catenuloplanes nepalensis]|uniref:RNA polymerase sigma factor n=1 Tax=Catenuloplanes nepalensis TaxID=587533 RepID=A0ABT9MSD8_9ACTN|nr:RNA polymerase sigma factor [Catenuloplanes nepalensis]MDP9794352.1 RNA polymerase sigma factor (sigma-70 family) [Catenuloplanes nepalensis]
METVEAVWRLESARIVAALTRVVHDVGLAEELAQDALVTALERWPADGVPDNPGAWLMTVAKRRALDHLRRTHAEDRAYANSTRLTSDTAGAFPTSDTAGTLPTSDTAGTLPTGGSAADERDDVLRLMFVTCHPVLPAAARVALTLKLVGGLGTGEIARGYLVTEQTIARRISSAKRTLAAAGVAFALPDGAELAERLDAVLEVVYLIFNEGYTATAGDDLLRSDLCQQALRLGRLLAVLAPGEAEVHGLVALMEIQASREAARTAPDGTPIPLREQNRGRWDRLLIQRGFAAMLRARDAGGPPGPYLLQGAIAACHAQARTAEETDWARIASLYATLETLRPTPVVRLNRAVAVGAADGPAAGLALADALLDDPRLRDYHLLPAVRGDLLARLGRHAEARTELRRAAALTRNRAEAAYLRGRADGLPADDQDLRGGTVGERAAEFLARHDASTRRSYAQTLGRLRRALGDDTPMAELTTDAIARACATAWGTAAPATWNRHRATIRSFAAWAGAPGLAAGLERRADTRTPAEVLKPDAVAALCADGDHPLRERALWLLLHESGATVAAALGLDVQDLDLDDRRAPGKGVTWRSGTARLLPELIGGRTRGPLFLAGRRPGPARTPADAADLCPETGRRRLSYERAEYLCKRATGATLRRFSPGTAGRRR